MKNKLLQLLIDNRGAVAKPTPAISDAASGSEETIYLYDVIVSTKAETEWFGGISAEELAPAIRSSKADVIHLRINSGGGDIFAAQAIAQAMRDFKGQVIAHIDGTCASAATVISSVADRVEMAAGALFMVHRAWTMAVGNMNDFIEMAAVLEKADMTIAEQYAAKTGGKVDDMIALMDKTTWLNAEEAKAAGFVDEVAAVIKSDAKKWNLAAYHNAPPSETESIADESASDFVSVERREFLARKTKLVNIIN
jgi:ATP-dependent Clp protease protease subunit